VSVLVFESTIAISAAFLIEKSIVSVGQEIGAFIIRYSRFELFPIIIDGMVWSTRVKKASGRINFC